MKAAVVTISTSLARGEGEDVSRPALVALCERAGRTPASHTRNGCANPGSANGRTVSSNRNGP